MNSFLNYHRIQENDNHYSFLQVKHFNIVLSIWWIENKYIIIKIEYAVSENSNFLSPHPLVVLQKKL